MNDQDHEGTIAIVGMSGRFPDAPDVATFWEHLLTGRQAIRPLTADELEQVDPALRRHPRHVAVTSAVPDVDLWDATFFGFSPREAEFTDPQHRLFLECAWEAMENAGYDPKGYPGIVGVIAGCGFPTYLQNNLFGHDELINEVGHLQLAIGNDRDALTTMVSYKLDLHGPSVAVQTSCSTSMVAVHMACQTLLNFESDLMLAGGAAISTPQKAGYVYEEGGILAADGVCHSLDARGSGGVFGNGVGVVVLKRTADALRDGDHIYAMIIGSATNNDGVSRAGYAAPGLRGQAEVMAEGVASADVRPDDISYVEAHGTGTLLGDSVELDAISRCFTPRARDAGACRIGSVKANVGHLDRASGITGLIKTALMLERAKIPPQVNFESPNPNLDLAAGVFSVARQLEDWRPGRGPRRAAVNSFGMGGSNAFVVMQERPPGRDSRAPQANDTPEPQLLVLSAKTPSALDAAAERLRAHLERTPDAVLADVAFTLQTGRTSFNHRRTLVARDVADAVAGLAGHGAAPSRGADQPRRHRRVALLIPDGPVTEPAAARACYDAEPVLRTAFDRHASITGADPARIGEGGPHDDAFRCALAALLAHWGVHPAEVIGMGRSAPLAQWLSGDRSLDTLARATSLADPAAAGPPALPDDGVVLELGSGAALRALDDGAHHDDAPRIAALPAILPSDPRVHTRDLLGRLWLEGVDIDWTALHAERVTHRIPLPTYPFERRRFWIDPAPPVQARRSEERREDVTEWFYLPAWHQAPRLLPGDLDDRLVAAAPWLITGADRPAAAALAERLRAAGALVHVSAGAGTGSEPLPVRPRILLHLETPDDDPSPRAREGFVAQQAFGRVRGIVGALAHQAQADPVTLVMVTSGAVRVGGADRVDPATAALVGLARVVPQENPGLRTRVVDIGAVEAFDTATGLVDELLLDAIEDEATTIAYRGGDRWRQHFDELQMPSAPAQGAVREGGTYLLTGGLGDVCLAIAGHLARTRQARIALLSRSGLPERDTWDEWVLTHGPDDRTRRRIERLRELEADGAEILVVTADVANEEEVAAAVRAVQEAFGPINGIVHGAGMQGDAYFGLAHELCDANSEEHFRAKVLGLAALVSACDFDRLDFCVTLSSLATVLGSIGHGAYAAANAAMDACAEQLFADGRRRVLTVNWDSWQNGEDKEYLGGAATIARYRMSYVEGITALERALSAVGRVPRLVNSTGDIVPRLAAWVATPVDAQVGGDRHPRPPLATPFVEPADDIERGVAAVWQDVMGLEEVGVLDSFFELGGHSLMAVQLIGRIRKAFGVNLPLSALAGAPTVRDLSVAIGALAASPSVESPSVETDDKDLLIEESA